eukprot:GFYU01005866.1.p1 GENE.GFYU01005866.1~~GFYU01005866.1.p1  ORF type:complete len:402 (+),score=75.95 GFYU01005866.1:134-1339(+)
MLSLVTSPRTTSSGRIRSLLSAAATYLVLQTSVYHSHIPTVASAANLHTSSTVVDMGGPILQVIPVTPGPMDTPDPFLFCVFHVDNYPAGDAKMQAPRKGNGADFDPSAPYRMYHGDRVPGFPQHPHRGFETITATIDGIIDHSDSQGNAGRYGEGDLQWMTAGKGIVHGEMFPLINSDTPNKTKFFQIWLNLPAKNKMVDPHFVMHWGPDVNHLHLDDNRVKVTVWAGDVFGENLALAPPPSSYASESSNDVAVVCFHIAAKGKFTLPKAKLGSTSNRHFYFLEGSKLNIAGKSLSRHSIVSLDGGSDVEIVNEGGDQVLGLLLQGKPIGEPVAQHGPFVMNTRQEIQQAFSDYQRTQFGGWPWPEDAMVFPREKGRFALVNGKESVPPTSSTKSSHDEM